jgi:hypothetical protein
LLRWSTAVVSSWFVMTAAAEGVAPVASEVPDRGAEEMDVIAAEACGAAVVGGIATAGGAGADDIRPEIEEVSDTRLICCCSLPRTDLRL